MSCNWLLVLSGILIISGQSREHSYECDKIADLAILVDSSRSLGPEHFEQELAFVENVLQHFDIGPDKTRIAVQTFSAGIRIEFHFNEFYSKYDVLNAIRNTSYTDGMCTLIYRGLEQARNDMFLEMHGARPGVQDVAIVLTDGETNPGKLDQYSLPHAKSITRREANLLKFAGVDIYSIGVGPRVDDVEMVGIASGRTNYFKLNSINDLDNLDMTKRLVNEVCTKEPRLSCIDKPADIFFVVDKSSSLASIENFYKELSFIARFVEGFNIGLGFRQTRVGVVTFSTDTRLEYGLGAYDNKIDVQDALLKINFTTGDTYTHKALETMLFDGFSFNGRIGVPHIGIIMTDGQSTDPYKLEDMIDELRLSRIQMFAVGFADVDIDELNMMASDPDYKHVYVVDDIHTLDSVRDELYIHVCNYIGGYEDMS